MDSKVIQEIDLHLAGAGDEDDLIPELEEEMSKKLAQRGQMQTYLERAPAVAAPDEEDV